MTMKKIVSCRPKVCLTVCCQFRLFYLQCSSDWSANLFIYVNVPSEVRSEVLDLCPEVFLHHSVQRDPKLFQLGFQRGQLRGLLHRERERGRSYHHSTRMHCLNFNMCNTVSITSLHKNHPGRRMAMTTAPLVSHRLFALMTLSSADKTRRNCF